MNHLVISMNYHLNPYPWNSLELTLRSGPLQILYIIHCQACFSSTVTWMMGVRIPACGFYNGLSTLALSVFKLLSIGLCLLWLSNLYNLYHVRRHSRFFFSFVLRFVCYPVICNNEYNIFYEGSFGYLA